MKIMKTRKDLFYWAGTGFVLSGLLIFLFFTAQAPTLFYGHWVFLILALLCCVFPFQQEKSGEVRRHSSLIFLGLIFLMQASLFALHFGLFPQASFEPSLQYGLFPWGFVAILAAGFSRVAYLQRENAFPHAILAPLIKTKVDEPAGIIINSTLKFAQSVALAITFALMILIVAHLCGFDASIPYSQAITLFGLFVLLLFSFTKSYNRIFTWISRQSAIFVIGISVLILGIIIALLNSFSHHANLSLPLPVFLNQVQEYPPANLVRILSLAWWAGLAPLAALFIARVSKGYSLRAMIAATLITPILFLLLSRLISDYSLPSRAHDFVGIAGFISTLILLMNKNMLSPLVLNYLPKNGESKFRNPEFLFRKLFQVALVFLYLYLPIGAYFSAGFMFVGVFPLLVASVLVALNHLNRITHPHGQDGG